MPKSQFSPLTLLGSGFVLGLLASLGIVWMKYVLAHPSHTFDLSGLFLFAASLGISAGGYKQTMSGWKATDRSLRSPAIRILFGLSLVLNFVPAGTLAISGLVNYLKRY